MIWVCIALWEEVVLSSKRKEVADRHDADDAASLRHVNRLSYTSLNGLVRSKISHIPFWIIYILRSLV